MGGLDSGRRWQWASHSTTADYRAIDVRRWRRDGLLEPGRAFAWEWSVDGEAVATIRVKVGQGNVRLIYRQRAHGDDWQDMDYLVGLTWTDCHLGGQRPWFLCPARV